ncbi:uncharacterized protein C8Q71DRAFT_731004, partial [Rhodofomes roseus]
MSPRLLSCLWRHSQSARPHARLAAPSRQYSASSSDKSPSRHAQFYSDLIPGMIPVALLGSAVYLALRLAQAHLSHEKFLEEAHARVNALEEEIEALRNAQVTTTESSAQAGPSGGSASTSRWWFR